MEEKPERNGAAVKWECGGGREAAGLGLTLRPGKFRLAFQSRSSWKTQGSDMCGDWECWNSGAADGDQHTPLGCVTFATIDLQFGLFSFRSKWFFHLRSEACKLNLSSALWAKVIILLTQNSLEAHTSSSVSFALFPSCARKSRVLVLKISSRVTRCSGSLWFFW